MPPESTQVLTFKLVIDGQEAVTTVEITAAELKKLQKVTQQFGERPFLKEFTRDLLNIEASAEEASSGIMEFIQFNQVTEREIQSVINTLREEQQQLTAGGVAWQKHAMAIQNLTSATQMAVTGQKQFAAGSSGARMAVSQMGFAVGDASMIFMDFRMFLLSIGNNIPFVVQGMATVSKEAKQAGMSMGQFMKSNMDMSMKLVLGANAVMFAMMAIPVLFKAINKSANEAAEEGLKKFEREMKTITEIDVEEKIKEINEEIETLTERLKKLYGIGPAPSWLTSMFAGMVGGEGEIQLETFDKMLTSLNDKQAEFEEQRKKRLGLLDLEIKNLDNEMKNVATNEELNKNILADQNRYVKTQITAEAQLQVLIDKKAVKQKEYDDLMMTSKDREEEKIRQLEEENKLIQEQGRAYDAYLTKIIQRYQLQSVLNELEETSNVNNIFATQKLITAELQRNLSLENRVRLMELLNQLQEDFNEGLDFWEESQEDMDKAYDEQYDKLKANEKEYMDFLDRQREARKDLRELEADESVNSIVNQFEREEQEALDHFKTELDFYQRQFDAKLITEEEYLRAKDLLEQEYARKSRELDTEAFLYKINTIAQLVSTITNAYNQIYSVLETNARLEVGEWREKEAKKLEAERDAALKHARTRAQREKINEQFDTRRDQLDEEANQRAKERLAAWFFINQAVSATNAIIASIGAGLNTLELLSKYLPPPLPQIAMGVTIAAGLAQAYAISQQKLPGYKKGGAVVGEDGIEIIAPYQDFASGMSQLITQTMMTLRDEIRSGNAGITPGDNSFSNADLKAIKDELTGLKPAINKMVNEGVRAYLDDRQAKKIYLNGGAQTRRGKI